MSGRPVILAGGSGFLGTLLAHELTARECPVIILSRRPCPSNGLIQQTGWDGRSLGPWTDCLNGAGAVINLTGRSVNCRPTQANRREIIDSRVNSVKILGEAIRRSPQPPYVFVQTGGEAIYGDYGDVSCDENSPPGEGFLVETCRLWEEAFDDLTAPTVRKVLLRIGFVLDPRGGAMRTLARLTKWGLGGSAGNGRQWINWIHSADVVRIFLSSIERDHFQGLYNASGPNPATNNDFMRALRSALRRPWSPPTPAWAVRLGARLMGTDPRLVLTGRRCLPKRLLEQDFQFAFPELPAALVDLLSRRTKAGTA